MDYLVRIEGMEIDFQGKLDEPYQFDETLDELMNYNEDTKDISLQEIHDRIARYSHAYFSNKGLMYHCRLSIKATEMMFERIINSD